MYKCGWNGCEKAYGTLNHLNAHVTMQSHGQKRTPEGKTSPVPQRWSGLSHLPARAGLSFQPRRGAYPDTGLTYPPAEFKEIRKEWKQRKKEDDAARKAEEDRQRQAAMTAANAAQNAGPDQAGSDGATAPSAYAARAVQLPPIGYQAAQYPPPPSGGVQPPMQDYNGSPMYSNYPASPYGQPGGSMYNQRK